MPGLSPRHRNRVAGLIQTITKPSALYGPCEVNEVSETYVTSSTADCPVVDDRPSEITVHQVVEGF